ncbi:MAG: hypothetical protein GF383_07885 [Candidatus Lokiarchaeota archaeon]|nr:hypothetical protein [Candidatus Lokiarchaeota archaeon]MBD3340236.1 hypothetical protein [Candidatus Lokiarchaeota archaeon]
MLKRELVSLPIFPKQKLFVSTIGEFLEVFRDVPSDIREGMPLNFHLPFIYQNSRASPVLFLASPEDAREVVEICKDAYEGSYPYKEMEDIEYVRRKIVAPDYHVILFKHLNGRIVGCFKCFLDFDAKKGYMGGFMIKKAFQSKIDVVKAIVGSYIWMWREFRDEILVWYCENRTAHATSQYMTEVCGIKTVAFLPNKDVFYNEIESDVIGIIYDELALDALRAKNVPTIIPEIANVFFFADKRYALGSVRFQHIAMGLNPLKVRKYAKLIKITVKKLTYCEKAVYEIVTFRMFGTKSHFSFVHTIFSENLEKVEYAVENSEQLKAFVDEFIRFASERNLRYQEVFVSAYEPAHQRVFFEAGFEPRGYVPSWKYDNEVGYFEDCVVFNRFKGRLCKNLELTKEGVELLQQLHLNF